MPAPDDAKPALPSETDSYFADPIFDASCDDSNFIQIEPLNAVNQTLDGGNCLVTYVLPRTLTVECYNLGAMYIAASIRMVDENGLTPNAGAPDNFDASVVNIPLHSLIYLYSITMKHKCNAFYPRYSFIAYRDILLNGTPDTQKGINNLEGTRHALGARAARALDGGALRMPQ